MREGSDKWWEGPGPFWFTGRKPEDPLPNPMPGAPYDADAIAHQGRALGATRHRLVVLDGEAADAPTGEVLLGPDVCPSAAALVAAEVRRLRKARPELVERWLALEHDGLWIHHGALRGRSIVFWGRAAIVAHRAAVAAAATAEAVRLRAVAEAHEREKVENRKRANLKRATTKANGRRVSDVDAIAAVTEEQEQEGSLFFDPPTRLPGPADETDVTAEDVGF